MVGMTLGLTIVRVDSKGRVRLPQEMRETLGDIVELKHLGKEKILMSQAKKSKLKEKNAANNLAELFDTKPRRTGKPQNPSPEEIKSIWNE